MPTMSEHTQKSVEQEAEEYSKQFGPVNHHERVPAYIAGRSKALEEKEKEIEDLKRLLHDLTPGGSEFYNDPKYCAEWIRKSREENHYLLVNQIKELKAWKESSLSVTPDMQAIGKALGVRLGESVHDKILPGIERLKAENELLKNTISEWANNL